MALSTEEKLMRMVEAERRGILTPENQIKLDEVRSRNLFSEIVGLGTPARGAAIEALQRDGVTPGEAREQTIFQQQKPKSLLAGIAEEIPEFGGGLLGALIGTPGGPIGTISGAAIGGAGGEAFKQLGQRFFGDPRVPQTAIEAAKKIGTAGGRQAAFEAGGRLTVGIGGKILAPFKGSITPEAKIAEETLDRYMPIKTSKLRPKPRPQFTTITPAEATENRALDILQNISEKSLIGGGRIKKFNISREKAVDDMIDDLVLSFGERAESDVVGEAFFGAVEKKWEPSRMMADTLYNTAEEMTKNLTKKRTITSTIDTGIIDEAGKPIFRSVSKEIEEGIIPTDSLKKFAQPIKKTGTEIGSLEASSAGDDIISTIISLPENISFAAAKQLRTRLFSKINEFQVTNKKAPAIGIAKKAISLIDDSMEITLKKENPEALAIWREANDIYKKGNEQFNNKFIRGLIKLAVDKNEPELIVNRIFKPKAISNIRKTKAAVDNKTWGELKSVYVQDLIIKSTKEETQVVNGLTLNSLLRGPRGMGDKTLRVIFNPDELKALNSITSTLQVIQKKQGEGIGGMAIQLGQAGAVGTIVAGRGGTASKVASFFLGGPFVLAQLFTRPAAAKLLKEGVTLSPHSPKLVSILTRLAGMAREIEKGIEMREIKKPQFDISKLQSLTGISTISPQQPRINQRQNLGNMLRKTGTITP